MVISVAKSDASDFEVTEIFLRLAADKELPYLIEKKGFRQVSTKIGKVLFPPYRLHISDKISLGVRNYILFHNMTVDGIVL